MALSTFAKGISHGIDTLTETLAAPFADPVIRLGVTGLSRAGKTVFITSLVANLMNRGRMPGLAAAASGTIRSAYLQPQPDDTLPRFAFEDHLAALTAPDPHWPNGTKRISQLRLSLRVQPTGFLSGLQSVKTVHLDIIDYPGEWLLDLGLLDRDFAAWSNDTLERMKTRPGSAEYLDLAAATDADAPLDEPIARALAQAFTASLHAARDAGFSDCTPGRFLLPGDLEGSPVLTFAPLPRPDTPQRRSLWREFERRYESYKRHVVQPFFRDHFARIDRQVVLVDVLDAIHNGPAAVEDLRRTMADILSAFRPGRNAWLSRILGQRRVDRILFAATKADHLHHSQHAALTSIADALMRDARDRAEFAGAEVRALSIAALRTTVEEVVDHGGSPLNMVRGKVLATGKQVAFHPGTLPTDPAHILSPARAGAQDWLDGDYAAMLFAPAPLTLKPGDGPPHIRLDAAAQFLIGDRL